MHNITDSLEALQQCCNNNLKAPSFNEPALRLLVHQRQVNTSAECVIPHPRLRIPHSSLHIPHSWFRITQTPSKIISTFKNPIGTHQMQNRQCVMNSSLYRISRMMGIVQGAMRGVLFYIGEIKNVAFFKLGKLQKVFKK